MVLEFYSGKDADAMTVQSADSDCLFILINFVMQSFLCWSSDLML